MRIRVVFAVFIGGTLGTLARIGAEQAMAPLPMGEEIALAAVNLLGAFALGGVTGHGLASLTPALREGITTGVLGSYTTLSAIALIASSQQIGFSVMYVLLTFVVGVALAGLGFVAGRSLGGKKISEEIR
jgi:fluoride exporter